ncbi:hypothetical protein N0V93_006190 [Gnomoniopsis smithogilvyi]|uniref:Carbohydrate kinase PfkB domain-containing protein n=1 Tax=Gnomoniopsis smithogilvyi TaxID=1191159 RepID=A0A9W9CVD0_9PEZI|nr:hypothetical protein N0V93_006190 [Gnomoniopsis smithogilvyi]
MRHLVMVGACYLDTILSVPQFPEEDAKLRATSLRSRRGGNCGNSLEVLQQYAPPDLALHLVTVLPRRGSAGTEQVHSSFAGTRVDLSHSVYREDQTDAASCYVLHSQATGSRTIVNYNGLNDMTTEEFAGIAERFRNEDEQTWWHFEGRAPETTLECIYHLRHHLPRSRISVEVEKPGRIGLRELAKEADVVFYSKTWAEGEGYETAEDCLKGEIVPKAKLTLCTWGARGACARPPSGCEVLRVEPVTDAAVQIVDAIGAGDTFVAGALHGLLEEWGAHRTVSFAVALATAKVQQDGFGGLSTKVQAAG